MGKRAMVWLGGDGGSSERRLLGTRDSELGCWALMFLILAMAVFLSIMDVNWLCMTGGTWFLMVGFVGAARSAVWLMVLLDVEDAGSMKDEIEEGRKG